MMTMTLVLKPRCKLASTPRRSALPAAEERCKVGVIIIAIAILIVIFIIIVSVIIVNIIFATTIIIIIITLQACRLGGNLCFDSPSGRTLVEEAGLLR